MPNRYTLTLFVATSVLELHCCVAEESLSQTSSARSIRLVSEEQRKRCKSRSIKTFLTSDRTRERATFSHHTVHTPCPRCATSFLPKCTAMDRESNLCESACPLLCISSRGLRSWLRSNGGTMKRHATRCRVCWEYGWTCCARAALKSQLSKVESLPSAHSLPLLLLRRWCSHRCCPCSKHCPTLAFHSQHEARI